jgi:hypothetical protein
MMKMMILASRRDGMTHAEFRRYVTQVHGPLVRSVTEVADAIRHYHYNFPIADAEDTAFGHARAGHLDIVTQGWFDSREAQLANMAQPRYLAIVRPDEHRFAGPGAVMHYTHEARTSAGGAGEADGAGGAGEARPACKIFYFRRRRAGLSRDEFQAAWRTRFFDAFTANRGFPQVAAKYIQNHALPEADHPDGQDPKFFDVIDEIWLRTPDSLTELREDAVGLREVRRLEAELLDSAATRALVTETVVNIP